MPFAEIGDIRLHYQLADYTDPWRASEVVLLHHGFARNLEFWRAWVPLLARDFKVLRVDARGCGRSTVPAPGVPYSFRQWAHDAVALLDCLGIERVHWVAEASGGIVGLVAALAHPERIASLSLCNTPFRLPRATNDLFVPEEVERFGMGHWARKTLANRLDLDRVDPNWVAWSVGEFDRNPPHAAIAQHETIADADLFERLRDIRAPVLVMAGANSKVAPADQMRDMHSRLPHAHLRLFEGIGQGIAFSIPERCAAEVRAFIASVGKSGGAGKS
jgi:3-oxoadipate enol-lactonase